MLMKIRSKTIAYASMKKKKTKKNSITLKRALKKFKQKKKEQKKI